MTLNISATTFTGLSHKTVTDGITAGTTQTQAGATLLTTDINRVTVSGTNGDGVKLPVGVNGLDILIVNNDSTQTIQIWPNTGASIGTGSTDAVDPAALSAGSARRYVSTGPTSWYAAASGGLGSLAEDGSPSLGAALDTNAFAINESDAGNVASAGTTNIWTTTGNTLHVTGTTTITSFGTAPRAGAWRKVIFDDALTLTHSADLNLPTSSIITTAAGDMAYVYADTTTQFDVLYFRKDGIPLAGGGGLSSIVEDVSPELGGALSTNNFAIDESEGGNIASGASVNVWTTLGNTSHITGTTTITSFETAPRAGAWRRVIFDGILTLTNSANLALPGGANITTAVGDMAYVYADTTTQFDVLYFRKDGTAIVSSGGSMSNLVEDTTPELGGPLDTLGQAINESEGSVASGGTTDIWITVGNTVHVTGTTTITSFATAPNTGAWRKVIFDSALTLTDGGNLNLPGGANITTATDDFAYVYAETTTLFKVLYFKVDGTAVVTNLAQDTTPQLGAALDTNAFAIDESEAGNVASGNTTDIWATTGNTLHITGTTTITSLATAPRVGAWRKVIFDDALTLTNNANINLPGDASITTATDDFAFVYAETTTLFKVLYFKVSGKPVILQTNAEIKTAYEANADTNEFNDAEQTKLAGIEESATADQSNAEIKTAYEANADTNEFSDTEQTKLAGIDTGAKVGDVVGPASATDNSVARYDSTTGELLQDSGVTIDDDDNLFGHGAMVNAQTGTTYTLTATDNGKVVTLDNVAAITLTVPQTSTETLAAHFQCILIAKGAGQVTVAEEGSDTILSKNDNLKLASQGSVASVIKLTAGSPNAWFLGGDLVG